MLPVPRLPSWMKIFKSELRSVIDYRPTVSLLHTMTASNSTISQAFGDLSEISVCEDPCGIKAYIDNRIKNNDRSAIMEMTRQDVSPVDCNLLQHAQPSSVVVERSFSELKNILKDNRNFRPENIRSYLVLNFNSQCKELNA